MARVLAAGVAVADIVMRIDAFPREAEKYRASDALLTVGGCAANAAVAIARHGGHAMLAARLGKDLIGDMIAGELSGEGVDLSLCAFEEGAKSSFSSIYVDGAGERQIMNFRGRGLPETIDFGGAPRAEAVLVDNRWPALTAAALEAARMWGVPGVVDAEAPFDADCVRGATHIVFSMQGLMDYAPGAAVETALAKAEGEFDAWVAVTDGAKGAWAHAGGENVHVPGFAVDAVDTLGAGDIWHGVFALRLAEGADAMDAARFAHAASALKCASFGGIKACPRRAETEAFLASQRAMN